MTEPIRRTHSAVSVFYDGSCPLCLAEIAHYKLADSNDALSLIDVSSDEFVGDAQITQQSAMARFHVRLADGQQLSGAKGFVEVWKVIPSWSWLAKLASVPSVLPVMELFYRIFLRARPLAVRVFKGIRLIMGKHNKKA